MLPKKHGDGLPTDAPSEEASDVDVNFSINLHDKEEENIKPAKISITSIDFSPTKFCKWIPNSSGSGGSIRWSSLLIVKECSSSASKLTKFMEPKLCMAIPEPKDEIWKKTRKV